MDASIPSSGPPRQDTSVAARTIAVLRARITAPYGYHNSFHTHASEATPPSYNVAKNALLPHSKPSAITPTLPTYTCSIYKESFVDVRCEFLDPFLESPDMRWRAHYAILRGTRLSIHSIHSVNSKSQAKLRKQIHCFSLQHAEVGLAVDLPPEEPLAKCPVFDILPSSMRRKMLQTKPHLFEPTREWVLRLRLEGCQFLLAFESQGIMLDWVEDLCAAIDIAQPIDDRSYPRYRSLPRRSRRQNQLENSFRDEFQLVGLESLGQRLVQQQQRIISALYPNLANEPEGTSNANGTQRQNGHELDHIPSQDPDTDDLDPADIRESPYLEGEPNEEISDLARAGNQNPADNSTANGQRSFNPKFALRGLPPCAAAAIRYRRRCAPIMNKYSPRSSDIIFSRGKRLRIDHKKERLVPFELAPPRYPRGSKSSKANSAAARNSDPYGEPFLSARSWRNPPAVQVSSAEDDEGGIAPSRTASRESGRPSEGDEVASVHSMAGMTIASANETGEPVSATSTNVSSLFQQQQSQDSIDVGGGRTADDTGLTPLKEKAGQIIRQRRRLSLRTEEDTAHAFAGLVL
jgi:hypothetical protein